MICEVIPGDRFPLAWRSVADSVFVRNPDPFQNPFVRSWHSMLLPGGWHMDVAEMRAISEGAQVYGDSEGIVIELGGPNAVSHGVRFELTAAGLAAAQKSAGIEMLMGLAWGVYSPSGCWGVVMLEADFCWVGGERPFMDAALATVGGGEAARQEFESWFASWWGGHVSPGDRARLLGGPTWGR